MIIKLLHFNLLCLFIYYIWLYYAATQSHQNSSQDIGLSNVISEMFAVKMFIMPSRIFNTDFAIEFLCSGKA